MFGDQSQTNKSTHDATKHNTIAASVHVSFQLPVVSSDGNRNDGITVSSSY